MIFTIPGIIIFALANVLNRFALRERTRLEERLGQPRYYAAYLCVNTMGLSLMSLGFFLTRGNLETLYTPNEFLKMNAAIPVSLGFMSIAVAASKGYIQSVLRNPFHIGITLVAIGVLMSSGDNALVLICGTLIAISLFHIVTYQSLPKQNQIYKFRKDLLAICGGLVAYALTMNGYMTYIILMFIGVFLGLAFSVLMNLDKTEKE
jgi:uncharacterized membrane protein